MGLCGRGPVLQLIENCIFYSYGKARDCATHNLPYHYKSTCCSLTNGLNVSMSLIKSRLISGRVMSVSLAAVKGEPGTHRAAAYTGQGVLSVQPWSCCPPAFVLGPRSNENLIPGTRVLGTLSRGERAFLLFVGKCLSVVWLMMATVVKVCFWYQNNNTGWRNLGEHFRWVSYIAFGNKGCTCLQNLWKWRAPCYE